MTKRYRVYASAEAYITEAWEVEADSPEEAEAKLFAGDATFIDQTDVDSEDNREVIKIEEL